MSTQVIINDVIPKTQITATAGQTVFTTSWTANAASDVVVYARTSAQTPDDLTQLVSSANYTVAFVGGSEVVEVTFLVGRALNDVVTITRDTPADRLNLYTNTNFTPSMLNQDVGILTLVDQQAQLYNERVAPHYNVSATPDLGDPITGVGGDIYLPVLGANQTWKKNSNNTAITTTTFPSGGGLAPSDATYIVQTPYSPGGELPNQQALSPLATGFMSSVTGTGVVSTRTLQGTANQINVTNGTGTGNPVFSLSSALQLPGTMTFGGNVDANGYNISNIGQANIGNIQISGNSIISTDTNGNVAITPNGTGNLVLDGLNWPQADGTAGQAVTTNGSGQLGWSTVSTVTTPTIDQRIARFNGTGGALENSLVSIDDAGIVSGATQLNVDNLRLDGNTITSTNSNGNIQLNANGTGQVEIDDPGLETGGILVDGAAFETAFRVNDIGGAAPAQVILHRHSTTWEPILLSARSNSNTSAHATVTAGMPVFNIYGTGWLNSYYGTMASITFSADSTGTIADGSAPGRLQFNVTPNGALLPVAAMTIVNSGNVSFAANIVAGTWQAGTIAVSYGGTGASSLTGYVKGNGTSAFTASATIPNTDITGLGTMSTQNASSVAITGGTATLTSAGLTTGTISTTPSSANDIANKFYVDSVAQGLSVKAPALWGTTGNITLSGLGTQANGEWTGSLTAGDRILVKNQGTSADNGIYSADAAGWTRTADANSWDELVSAFLFVQLGATLADTSWVCTIDSGGTLGVTPVTFVQFSGAGTYTAGTGLTLAGNQFSITNTAVTAASYGGASSVPTFTVNAQGQLTAASDVAVVAPAGTLSGTTLAANVVSSSLTSVGTLTGGTWNANTITVSYGGTGIITATAYSVLCGGTTSTGAFQSVASVGTAGQVLTSNGAGALPSFQNATGGADAAFSLMLMGG